MRTLLALGTLGLAAALVVPASAQTETSTPPAATQQQQAQPSGMCGCCQRMAMMQGMMGGQQGGMQMPGSAPATPAQ